MAWSAPSQAGELYLNVVTNPEPDVGGGFKVVDVANLRVTGHGRWVLSNLSPATYYCRLFGDRPGRRVVSDLVGFEVR